MLSSLRERVRTVYYFNKIKEKKFSKSRIISRCRGKLPMMNFVALADGFRFYHVSAKEHLVLSQFQVPLFD